MIKVSEEFYQSLGIAYQTIAIVSKEINNAAAMKFDLEAWFPGDNYGAGQYRELVSCSNCTDYQARMMKTKCGYNTEDPYAHMLNSTLCATERAMCCLVENYQEEGGVRVPRALVPYCMGMEFFPFLEGKGEQKKEKGGKKDAAPKAKAEAKKEGSPKAKPKAEPKKEEAKGKAKAEPKKDKKASKGETEEKPKTPDELEAERKKQMKTAIKEGG